MLALLTIDQLIGQLTMLPAGHSRCAGVWRGSDRRNARIEWTATPGVVGYNIRWGLAQDTLYETDQRYADEGRSLDLRALTIDQHYFLAMESFDENGVSRLGDAVRVE